MISHEMVGVQKLEYNFGIISTKLQYGMDVGKLEINPNPKWHFLNRYPLTHACNSKFFGAKLLLLKCSESATKWLYPKNVSGSVQALKQRIKVDKLDFFKNAS